MSSPATNSVPSEGSRRHSRRKQQARLQLLGVLSLIVAAFAALLAFAFSEQGRSRWPAMVGVSFGAGISLVLLFGAVWTRQNWARVLLTAAIFLAGALFGVCLLFLLSNPVDAHGPGVRLLGLTVTCLVSAGTWLALSRRIRYLTTPPGSGG
jgi:peptidoglycan/LPS O-acetylase OafA/YrhL